MAKNRRKNKVQTRFKLEQLEARTLYSADPISAGLYAAPVNSTDAHLDDITPTADDWRLYTGSTATETYNDPTSLSNSEPLQEQIELVFIDTTTPDYELLIEDLLANQSFNRSFEIITIQADDDGIQIITDTLADQSNVNAVHIISHGSDGNVNLGETALNRNTLPEFESSIAMWGNAFTEDGDLLIYGCDFAATESGVALGARIAALAEIDVASSDDKTGGLDGSDWVLEQVVGSVETTVPFSQQLQDDYQRSLASSITVTTNTDVVDGTTTSFDDLNMNPGADGEISLREAIIAANTQPGADTIDLMSDSYSLTFTGNGQAGDLDITSEIIINGTGNSTTNISALGLNERIFEIDSNGSLSLNDLTLQDNFRNQSGGAINNSGNLETNSVVLQNFDIGNTSGGAIYNEGTANLTLTTIQSSVANNGGGIFNTSGATLTINTSTLQDNTAKFSGGAIKNEGTLTVLNTAITDNLANGGAGIHNQAAASITNSTFHGNNAQSNNGGGFFNANGGQSTIEFSTFSENAAKNSGGGVFEQGGTVTIGSSVLSGNGPTMFGGEDIEGVSISTGYNIINSTDHGSFTPHPTDIINVDPQLLPLANNGGPTETHALSPTSIAIDAGSSTTIANDQRGFLRDANPDSGAFEQTVITVSDSPVITPSITTTTYTENTALIVDSSMTVSDTDSPDFNTGTFTVTSTGFTDTTDVIFITPTGTGPGEIDLAGNTVLYEGTSIGTWNGGNGSSPLQVNLNAASAQPAINALAQAITFTIATENPNTTARTLSYETEDGDGSVSNTADITIEITPANDAPTTNVVAGNVWINEIHGLNAGADTNEGIEIAGAAGTDLQNWRLVTYTNANSVNQNQILSGTIPDESNGFGAILYPMPVIGGSVYAMALIDNTGTVVEFLSYRGVITPTINAAAGLTSEDIGVREEFTTPVGHSLQRNDFGDALSWSAPLPHTYDSLNQSQSGYIADALSTNEDTTLVLSNANNNAIIVDDIDTTANLKITLTVSSGLLAFSSTPASNATTITFTGTLAQINAELDGLIYQPDPDFNGIDTLQLLIDDQEPTGSLSTAEAITIIVNSVSDAPSGTDQTLSIDEDSTYTLDTFNLGFTDLSDFDSLTGITITKVPAQGTLTLSGVAVSVSQVIDVADITSGNLVFTPTANQTGTPYDHFDFRVNDSGTTANGGFNQDQTANRISFNVNGISDAPAGTDNTLSTNEDTPLTINVADFGFSDPLESNGFAQLLVTTLPTNGTLTLAGTQVVAGQQISVTDITNGQLVFTPLADDNGAGYANFDFQVIDDGSTTSGGVVLDPTPNKITIDVLSVSDEPAGADNTITIIEDAPYTLADFDFGFSDSIDGDTFTGITITRLPAQGSLMLSGVAVSVTQVVSINDITSGNLTFLPAANQSGTAYDSFDFRVNDSGTTANGGINQDQLANTITFDVVNVSDAPQGKDKVLSTNEDTPLTIDTVDFGFTDPVDGDFLASLVVTTLPANGLLSIAGTPVSAGQQISVTDITNGLLVFTPQPDDNGSTYAEFGFQVIDTGSTANGGIVQDASTNKITIDVLSVSDEPAGTDNTITIDEDATYALTVLDFGFSDSADNDSFTSITLTKLPTQGSLLLSGAAVTVTQVISTNDIVNGNLVFVPAANQSGVAYDNFDFRVNDSGTTANGGINQDQLANTITFDVLSISEAPEGKDKVLVTSEDTPLTINTADFGFSDPDDGDAFASLIVTNLPASGTLSLAGNMVTAGQQISITDIASGQLVFTPVPDDNGIPYTDFGFQVIDNGSTANGGMIQDQTPNKITIEVISVSDEPAGTDNTITIDEDATYALTDLDFGFSDSADNDSFTGITLTKLPTQGSLLLSGAAVTVTQVISTNDINNGNLVFVPAANQSGAAYDNFDFRVNDSGTTANGGINQDQLANTITFDVLSISEAPEGKDKVLATSEDTPLTINTADFGFSDPDDGDAFASLIVTNLPASGTLSLAGNMITAGQQISITDIANGQLVFTPTPDDNGIPYTDFGFQVIDNGSTANGGMIQDQTPNKITIEVISVSDEPAGTDNTITIDEDATYALTDLDFGFSDSADNDSFTSITLTKLPTQGSLLLSGTAVTVTQVISANDIINGNLVFVPAANQSGVAYDNFDFRVNDSGSTANGGINQDQLANRITFNVNGVSEAPAGQDNTLTVTEDTSLVINSTDFGFTDANDNDLFAAVTITQPPTAGTLYLNGVAVTANQVISITSINNGALEFRPLANQSGISYADFRFLVHDNGSTSNGGQTIAQNESTITLDVTPVNDAPQGTDATYTLLEDQSRTLSISDFGYTDPIDNHAFVSALISSAPTAGQLLVQGTLQTAGDIVAAAAIANGDVVFVPASGFSGVPYDSFSFQVQDNGGLSNGGLDTDQTPATLTFNVTPVSDEPAGTDGLITLSEDTPYAFALADFGFSDPLETAADQFQSVSISQLPVTGTLTNNGNAVIAGQSVNASDITSGNLVYTPSANSYGQSFDSLQFSVIDSGSTANGGQNQDQTDNQIIFDIISVSDAPLGSDNILTTNEDTSKVLTAQDFGFSDPADGDAFTAITVVNTPANGTLALAGAAIANNQLIGVADINSGNLVFTPALDQSASGYADFTFLVHDSGSSPGSNTSQIPNTVTFNVNPVNDAPEGTDSSVQVPDNITIPLSLGNFGYSDTENDNLQSITINSLPINGTLLLNGVPVAGGDVIAPVSVSTGALVYVPANNITAQDTIDFTITDTGGVANGGQDTDQSPARLTLTTVAVNDAPFASDNTVLVNEDNTHVFTASDFGFSDPQEQHGFAELIVASTSGSGTLSLNGAAINSPLGIPIADINAGLLTFAPDANSSGSNYAAINFNVRDNGGTANGGQDTSQATNTVTISVAAVNDAPTGIDRNAIINEDTQKTITATDFGFSDPLDSDSLMEVIVSSLSGSGSVLLNGTPITAGTTVSATDINAGALVYTPDPETFGSNYASIGFQLKDSGGTSNGGQDTSQPNLLTFDVLSVNDAPSGADSQISTSEDTPRIISISDFGFSDSDNNQLLAISVTSTPSSGSLQLNQQTVFAGDVINASSIAQGNLIYQPAPDSSGNAAISFVVIDDGGTDSNGQNTDPADNTLQIAILPVNDAPSGADKTVSTIEDTAYTFSLTDFSFTDPADGHSLQQVTITTLPTEGQLTLNGNAQTAGAGISSTDIAAGNFAYTPASQQSGIQSFTFQVQDNGGVTNGGADLDATPDTINIDVDGVNDAPTAQNSTFTINESSTHLFKLTDFGFTDSTDSHTLQSVIFDQLPGNGVLLINGAAAFSGQTVSAGDIANERIAYQPAATESGIAYDEIHFRVQDNGGTDNNGQDTSLSSNTITFNVAATNSAPSGTNKTINIIEDETHILNIPDFGFSDIADGDSFTSVIISSLTSNGLLSNNGQPVSIGDAVPVSDINNGSLHYTPVAPDATHQIGFQVQDSGIPSLGNTIDLTENTITYDVLLINNAPVLTNSGATFDEGSDNLLSPMVLEAIDPDDTASELLFSLQQTPANGTLTLNGSELSNGDGFTMQQLADNQIRYIHDGSETLTDFFDFTLADGGEDGVAAVSARFNIDINEVIDQIPALPDTHLEVTQGGDFDSLSSDIYDSGDTSLLDASALDQSRDTDQYQIEIVQQPENGAVTLNPDGTFLYTHNGSGSTTDSFTYRIINEDAQAATATVNFTVVPDIAALIEEPVSEFPVTTVIQNPVPVTPTAEPEEVIQIDVSGETDEIEIAAEDTSLSENNTGALNGEPDFSAQTVSAILPIDEELDFQNTQTHREIEIQSNFGVFDRDELQRIDVRHHNQTDLTYVFTDVTNQVKVNSVELNIESRVSLTEVVYNRGFQRGLSTAQLDLEQAQKESQTRLELGNDVAVSVSISTTAGILAWLLRGGALFGSLMSATPLWSSLDPMRITDSRKSNSGDETSDVENMFR